MKFEKRKVKTVRVSKSAILSAAEELDGDAFKLFILLSALSVDVDEVKRMYGDEAFYWAFEELACKNYVLRDEKDKRRAIIPDISYGEDYSDGRFLVKE